MFTAAYQEPAADHQKTRPVPGPKLETEATMFIEPVSTVAIAGVVETSESDTACVPSAYHAPVLAVHALLPTGVVPSPKEDDVVLVKLSKTLLNNAAAVVPINLILRAQITK